jgi:PAS domain S-box-containing protein
MNDVIWQTTPDMVFTYVSPSIKEQRGYDANEVLGRQIWDFIAPNEILSWRKRVKQPFNLLLSREAAFETEPYELHVRKDGTTLWTETMATPVINHEGNLIAFQGVTRDITERKQLEEALRTTLGRYHTILSSLYAAVLVVAEDGRVEFANQAFCDLFHLEDPPENLRGLSPPAMIQKIKDVYAQPAYAMSRIQAIVAQGDPVKGEEIAMRDGRFYLVDFVPIHIDGKPCGRMWHHQDITERKRAEDELRVISQLELLKEVL